MKLFFATATLLIGATASAQIVSAEVYAQVSASIKAGQAQIAVVEEAAIKAGANTSATLQAFIKAAGGVDLPNKCAKLSDEVKTVNEYLRRVSPGCLETKSLIETAQTAVNASLVVKGTAQIEAQVAAAAVVALKGADVNAEVNKAMNIYTSGTSLATVAAGYAEYTALEQAAKVRVNASVALETEAKLRYEMHLKVCIASSTAISAAANSAGVDADAILKACLNSNLVVRANLEVAAQVAIKTAAIGDASYYHNMARFYQAKLNGSSRNFQDALNKELAARKIDASIKDAALKVAATASATAQASLTLNLNKLKLPGVGSCTDSYPRTVNQICNSIRGL